MFAALPMYDWDGARAATDALWVVLRDAFRTAKMPAPDALARPFAETDWLRPDLTLAQACGMPYRLWLHGKVTLLGAAEYAVQDCPPGYYRSHIVVRRGEKVAGKAAVNALHSQSGYGALVSHLGPPGTLALTGSHAASIVAVASGDADYAAIDAVSWLHALRDLPAARKLDIVASTPPTPGLPFITAASNRAEFMQPLVEKAVSELDSSHRDALFLRGFVRFTPQDYLL